MLPVLFHFLSSPKPVSYTHLDVYKRQELKRSNPFGDILFSVAILYIFSSPELFKLPSIGIKNIGITVVAI